MLVSRQKIDKQESFFETRNQNFLPTSNSLIDMSYERQNKVIFLLIIKGQNNLTMMKTIEGYTYKINEHIGKGYSSTVHKGIKEQTGQAVSIKVIEMAKLEDPINQMLLQHEITALKKLTHSSNVLHFYDVYATKNNTYIMTELCDGDLGSMLKKRKNIPYYEAVEIFRQIVCGYMDIYRIGYLHRDIKPANIFHKGSSYKIGDFGFAIPAHQLDNHKDYNVGSPVYMPPEALKDNRYSVSCDTWAIGVILFQMIKGVVPWRAISEQKLHQKIITESLDQLTIGMPEIARGFLSKVLNLDPEQRMTIEEMVTWPSRLNAIDVRPLHEPLREIKSKNKSHNNLNDYKNNSLIYTPKQVPSSTILINHSPTPKLKNCRTNSDRQYIPQKNNNTSANMGNENKLAEHNMQSVERDDGQMKEAMDVSDNLIHFLKFIHRVLKFIGHPAKIQLNQLEDALATYLHQEFDSIDQLINVPSVSAVEKWEPFIKGQKGQSFRKKFQKYKTKYRMFHPQKLYNQLSQPLLKKSIHELLRYLECQENFDEKTVIAADYLTTMYQLYDLKDKYTLKQFLKMSKIDIIMQGNPYSATKQHLVQLKKKISLLDI